MKTQLIAVMMGLAFAMNASAEHPKVKIIGYVKEAAEPGWRRQDSPEFVHWYRELVRVAEARYGDNLRGNEARFERSFQRGFTPEKSLKIFYRTAK